MRAKKKLGSQPPITVEQILDVALALVDAEGFEALSMRRVAKDLGVYPQTLYWHIGNKAQLIALLFQRVLGHASISAPERAGWRIWLRNMAFEVRRALGAHPALAAAFASSIQVSSPSLRLSEFTLQALHHAGFAGQDLLIAYNTFMGSVFGWISTEFSAQPNDADATWQEEFREHLGNVGDDAPTIRENVNLLANKAFMLRWDSGLSNEMELSFALMVDSLLDRFQDMLKTQ